MAFVHNGPLPAPDRHSLWMTSDVAKGVDYYVTLAGSVDGAIAGYRALTGKATLMPKWAYGFWQSRQRYETQEQLLDVMREYRKRRIPIDNIVQAWFYWPENAWGSTDFDNARKSVVSGRRVSVRHDRGGRRIIRKIKTHKQNYQ